MELFYKNSLLMIKLIFFEFPAPRSNGVVDDQTSFHIIGFKKKKFPQRKNSNGSDFIFIGGRSDPGEMMVVSPAGGSFIMITKKKRKTHEANQLPLTASVRVSNFT